MDCGFSGFQDCVINQLHKLEPSRTSDIDKIKNDETRIWRLSTAEEKEIMKEKYWTEKKDTDSNDSNCNLDNLNDWILLDGIWDKERFDYKKFGNNILTYMIEFKDNKLMLDWKRDYTIYQANWRILLAIGSSVECWLQAFADQSGMLVS